MPKTCQVDFPDPNELLMFKLIITPDEVMYRKNTAYSFNPSPIFVHNLFDVHYNEVLNTEGRQKS